MSSETAKKYRVQHFSEIDPVACPCGFSRRAFATPDNPLATVHCVEITIDAKRHYHKKMTEIYIVLEGEGVMELDDDQIPVRPLSTIFIQPGCRHRTVGKLKIINVAIPA